MKSIAALQEIRLKKTGLITAVNEYPDRVHPPELGKQLFAHPLCRQMFIEQSRDGMVVLDHAHRILFANERFAQMLGYQADELYPLQVEDWYPGFSSLSIDKDLQDRRSRQMECEFLSRQGNPFPVELTINSSDWESRRVYFCVAHDISQRKHYESELHARELEFRTLVEHTPDIIIRYDSEFRRLYANPHASRVTGSDQQSTIGGFLDQTSVIDVATYKATLQEIFDNGHEADLEFRYRTLEGQLAWGHARFAPEMDAEGKVVSVLSIIRDITESVHHREQANHMAFYDNLTNLPNRALLNERLTQIKAESEHRDDQFALMLLDLDDFKDVNDSLGHTAGDQLLIEVARRLQGCIRDYDTLSRQGGDEFVALMTEIRSPRDMGKVANEMLKALARPVEVAGQEVFISASIGIAVYPEDSKDLDELFAYADIAMYHAKSEGRNNFKFFQQRLSREANDRLHLTASLRQALARNELELYYQPKVDMSTGEVMGAEALLRWNHPERGLLTPDKFIGLAEDTGQILEIGNWVMHRAAVTIVNWNQINACHFTLAINMSTRQFHEPGLVADLKQILSSTGCHPDWLELELTESLLLENSVQVQRMLDSLNQLGISLAIDDFGTGQAALSYLNRFCFSVLKIDKSFIHGAERDDRRKALIKAIVSVARALDMELVGEGVETQEQVDMLLQMGCNVGQGYYYGKPIPQDVFESLYVY